MVAIQMISSASDSRPVVAPHCTAHTKVCLFWMSLPSVSVWLLRWDFSSPLKTWYKWIIVFLFLALDAAWLATKLPCVTEDLPLKLFSLGSWEENLSYCHTRHQDAKTFLRLRGSITLKTQAKVNTNEMSWDIYENYRGNNKNDGRDINFCSI